MSTRIVTISNGGHLSLKHQQLVLEREGETHMVPVEDMLALILENPQTTITQPLLQHLMQNNVAVISCDDKHLPTGMMLSIDGHTTQTRRLITQASMGNTLKNRLWKQLIQQKIIAQGYTLVQTQGTDAGLYAMAKKVKTGDSYNLEAQAARRYWSKLFENFSRNPDYEDQNRLLNYGYAIVRAVVARNIVATGLHPSLGLHHHNQYNSYCLADDVMEPFRPYVDLYVYQLTKQHGPTTELTPSIKAELMSVIQHEVTINQKNSPLHIAIRKTAQSLTKVIMGEEKTLLLPYISQN